MQDFSSSRIASFKLLLILAIGLLPRCSMEPPEGEPLDFDLGEEFALLELPDVEGTLRSLPDLLGKVTLVSFFFPT